MQENIKHKILIIAPSWVGDLVMSQTLFKLLKTIYNGEVVLDIFANSWTIDILSRMTEVSNIIKNPFEHKKLALLQRIRLGIELRKNQYNQVIILPNSFKSAILPYFANIKQRTGFIGEFRYGLLNDIYKLDKIKLPRMVDRFCALANKGQIPSTIEDPLLNIDIDNQNYLIAKHKINTNKINIAFCPAAEYGPAKRWPTSHFSNLARLLLKDNYNILILGSSKDANLGLEIIQQINDLENITNLCGKTSLADTVDILSLCKYAITNDSGLMHIACATNTIPIAVYGSSSPVFTPPLSPRATIIQLKLECSPCFQRTCQYGHYNCLNLITPDMVYQKINYSLNLDK